MKEAPFTCSRQAERFLNRLLDCRFDHDPAIVVSMGLAARDAKGEVYARVNGVHFTVGLYRKGERPKDSFFSFRGKPVSIMAATLDHLDGKHIVLTKPDWTRRRLFARKTILRAESPP